jgi:hypothetical protein
MLKKRSVNTEGGENTEHTEKNELKTVECRAYSKLCVQLEELFSESAGRQLAKS